VQALKTPQTKLPHCDWFLSFSASVSDAAAKTVMSAARATDGTNAIKIAKAPGRKSLKDRIFSPPHRDI
jgi:hypothetical protein